MIEEQYTEVEQQEQQVPEQDPPTKAKKLYNSLISDGYTKENIGSEDEFIKALGNRQTAQKIYNNLLSDGYTTDNLGDENEFLTTFSPSKKKVSSVVVGESSGISDSEAQSILQNNAKVPKIYKTIDGRGIPDDDIVSLSKEANRLEQKRDLMAEQSPESMISPMPGAWKMPTENPLSEGEAKVIRETVKSKGYDPDEVFNDYRDIPDEIAKQQGFRLEDKEFNPQMYYRKLGAAAWQSNLKNSLDVWEKTGDISSEDAAKVKELVYNSTIPGKTYSQRRKITADLSAALSSYIPDEEKRKRLLSNLATDRSISYGVLSPEDKQVIENSPEREYLDFDQTLGYQYLEDTDPEIAKGYKDLFVSDKAIDAEGNARAGWQFKASRLKTIGLQIQQSAVQEQINNLKNLFDQQNGELSPEQQAKYEELQLESERLKSESAQIPIKYPFPAQYNAVQNAQEILGSQLIEKGGVVGGPLWLLGKTSESIVSTGKGILDLAGEAVNGSESEASKVQRMAVLGEQKMLESIYQIPQKDQAMKSFEVVTSPEIKSQIDAIKNDKTLSYDDKLKKIVDIQIKNPGAISRLPIHNGKLDINPTTMFYAAGELASAIVPYIGLEAMTGGGATAGLARKFASSFNAAFLTGFRDAYAAAIDKGVPNPYTYAIRNTAINSLAMAGAGTPQMIKQLAGTKSAIGQVINNMSNKSIQEMIDIGNKSISLFGKSIKTRPLVNAATAVGEKALEGMGGFTKFEAAMLPAKVLNKKLNDEEINHEEMLKESVVMIATGGIVGLTGARERYKQLNDIDKGGYLKAAENPQAHIETAQKMLVDGLMTREDYDKAVSNIKLASEVSGRTKFVDNNGNKLSQKKKADLLLLKMQEAELQKQTMGDVPDKLREKVRQENEELKSEMDKVYEPESSESTFESAKEGDVVIHQGKEVVVVSRGKSRGGTDIVTVKRLPRTKDEIKAQALQNVFNRVASEYKNLNPTWKDIEQNHPSEVRKEIEELTKLENSLVSSTYTIGLEQWNSEVKPKTGEGNKSEVPEQQKQIGITEISSEEVKPQIGEVVRTETNQPVSEVTEIPEGQGTKETVSESANAVGQGKSETAPTVLIEKRVIPFKNPEDLKGYKPENIMRFKQGVDNNEITLIVDADAKVSYQKESGRWKKMSFGKTSGFKHILKDVAKNFRESYGKDYIIDLRGIDLSLPLEKIIEKLNESGKNEKGLEVPQIKGESEATTTVLSEREVVPTEKSTEGKEVELPVTKSGLTEVEREKLIQEREKKTAIPEKDKETQDILNDISKYNKLPNGRLGKLKPEGLKSLNKIREKVRAFNDKHGTNYSFDDRAGKLYDKNKKGLTGAVKGKNVYDPDSGIDRSGKPLRERDKDVIDAFDQLMEVGALPTGYGTDGRRMSSSQLDATVQDILDGVPSRRANNYLDALEKMVREDDFDFSQPDFQQTNRISLADIVGIEKETATEPMTEEQVDKWLEDESQMTREDERLFDNIENLINEYEIENGFEREVEQPPATTETTVSAETKPNEKSGSTAAESTGTGKESGKVESPESEKPGAGEGAPPNEPPNEKASTAFEEQKRTTFSHKGIQEVATEYGLDDVTSRERVSDLELFRRADETISKWVSEGSYRRNINDLLQRSKEGEILPTPEQNIIIAQHIAQLRGAAEKARKEFGVNSKEYNDALTELQDVSSVGAKIRSDIGAALRVPNLSRTYMQTLEDAMVTKMDAVGADVLTESQKREVEEQFEKIKIEKERFETLYNEAVTKNNELAAENELLKIQKDKKAVFGVKRDYKAHRQSLKEQLKNEVEKYKQEGNKMGISSDGGMKSFEISVKMAEIIMKILKSHVEEAGAKLADVTKRTFEDVKDLFEGITENDIRDVIAGVYSKKEKTLTQLQADMKDVQAEAKLLNELDRVMQGVPKNEKQEKEKNRKLFELKKQIDALKKESGLDQYSDEAKIKRAILSIKRQEEKIRERINSKDYSKEEKKKGVFDNPEFKRKYPDLYKKLLDAYTAKEGAQHEFDIALAKDEYEKMSKMGKVFDFGDKALNTTKKLVTGIDLSAMGIQGLFAILRRPVVGGIALKESFLDLASKKRFERQIAEIHNSGIYDLMQKSGLDITEPKSLLAKEKEEIFSGQTLDINVKYKGKSYKIIEPLFAPFERAFTSLGNNLRAIAFSAIAEKYMKEGNTFENNPKLFKDLAKMLNTETGRGEQNQYLQRASEFVTKGIWSPRLMASRLNLLGVSDAIALVTGRKLGTKGYYSQLSPEMRIEAAKSVGQFMLSVYALSYLAAYALGGDLDDEPDSSTFMDIKVGDKSYNLTGGFSQYVKLVAQSVRGGRKIEGDFREFKGEKSVLTNFGHFMRGKLTPASGVLADVLSGMKDYSNRPVTASDEITKLTIPLSLRDTKNQMEKDGLSSIFSHILPSFIGINVKDKRDYETNDLSVKEFKFLYDKGVRLPQTLQENLKVENSKGEEVKVSDADFEKFKNEKNKIIQGYVKKIMDKGYPKMVNGFPKIVPAKELDTEELQDAMDRYSRKATKQAKEKIFGVKQKSIEDKISEKVLESAIKGWERQ